MDDGTTHATLITAKPRMKCSFWYNRKLFLVCRKLHMTAQLHWVALCTYRARR